MSFFDIWMIGAGLVGLVLLFLVLPLHGFNGTGAWIQLFAGKLVS